MAAAVVGPSRTRGAPQDERVAQRIDDVVPFEPPLDHDHKAPPAELAETALAETLVRYKWEIARLYRHRGGALLATYREIALKVLLKDDPGGHLRENDVADEDRALIRDLVSPDPNTREKAELEFREDSGWEPADVLGLAYARSSGARMIDDRIADLERRGRVLHEDYARLRLSNPGVEIEEAEVLEGACDD